MGRAGDPARPLIIARKHCSRPVRGRTALGGDDAGKSAGGPVVQHWPEGFATIEAQRRVRNTDPCSCLSWCSYRTGADFRRGPQGFINVHEKGTEAVAATT